MSFVKVTRHGGGGGGMINRLLMSPPPSERRFVGDRGVSTFRLSSVCALSAFINVKYSRCVYLLFIQSTSVTSLLAAVSTTYLDLMTFLAI